MCKEQDRLGLVCQLALGLQEFAYAGLEEGPSVSTDRTGQLVQREQVGHNDAVEDTHQGI